MANGHPTAYDQVADAYSRVPDADGSDLVDLAVLTELVGDVGRHRVLSLACGQGLDARMLADLGATVTGVDLSPEMLRYACEHEATTPRGITYVQGDATNLARFEDRTFDGVVCHMALMDIPDLAPTIGSVARVLRDDGWFVFSIVHPCFREHVEIVTDYLVEHRYEKRIIRDWLPAHAYHRSLGAYINLLAHAGFRVERVVEEHHTNAGRAAGGVPSLLYARASKT